MRFILPGSVDRQKLRRRGISHQTAVVHFFLVKCPVILLCRRLNAVMFGMVRLNDCHSRLFASSGAADCLRQQLERTLPGTVIDCIQGEIRRQRSHQRDIREIVAFYDHLGSNQDIGLPRRK